MNDIAADPSNLPSSRKRPRKPPSVGIQYESNYETAFEDDWDAEDEYLAKRRGIARPLSKGRGDPSISKGYNTAGGNGGIGDDQHNGYPQQPAPISSNTPRFKPGPNHVAISQFIQWHRQLRAPQQQLQGSHPVGASRAAALAASAVASARRMSQNHAGEGVPSYGDLDTSSLAALLPTLQAGFRQRAGSSNGASAGNQLAGLLSQLVAGQQRRGQTTTETIDLLQQFVRKQSAQRQRQQQQQQQPPVAVAPQSSAEIPLKFADVLARLKNAQAKVQGFAMAAAATQERPAPLQNGQQQRQQQQQCATNQPPAAVLQNLKALLTANAQRTQQQGTAAGQPGQLPPSHVGLMKILKLKQSLDIANANPNIKARVAQQQQQQQQQQQGANGTTAPVLLTVDNSSDANASVVPITIAATPAETAPTIIATAEPAQIKIENDQVAIAGAKGAIDRAADQGSGDTDLALDSVDNTNPATVPETSDQIKENVAVPSIPSFQPPPTGALDAMRAYLVQQKQFIDAPREKEGSEAAEAAAEVNNNGNGNTDKPVEAVVESAV